MIKIRSTELLATTDTKGFANVLRIMDPTIRIDPNNYNHTIVIESHFFIEQETVRNIEGKTVDVVERIILQKDKPIAFTFTVEEIDSFFRNNGLEIIPSKSFFEQQTQNKLIILLGQTTQVNWQNMKNWIPDTDHILVTEFTKIV